MLNKEILVFEEKVYGMREYNLEIICNSPSTSNFHDYIGNFLVTEKGYLLRGTDNNLKKRKAELRMNNSDMKIIVYENGHTANIIKKFGKLKLVDTLILTEREGALCFV